MLILTIVMEKVLLSSMFGSFPKQTFNFVWKLGCWIFLLKSSRFYCLPPQLLLMIIFCQALAHIAG